MAITFTPQQQKVIDLHGRNILVSAAAGSGKTAVLVERIIRMICREEDPVDIDRLLIVTFTNAAAAEMRERISQGITRELALHPASEHLQRQAALLHNAQITTIDSFCMFLLKNHFNEIGVDPAFRVMDEGEKKLLIRDVMDGLMEDKFAEGTEEFHYCVEYFCPSGRESVLEDDILQLYQFAESYPWPEEWLKERKKDYVPIREEELDETDYGKYLVAHIRSMLESCKDAYVKMQQICQEPDGPYMYGELIDNELEQLERLLQYESLREYSARIPAFFFGRLSSKKDDSVSLEKRELVKALRSNLKDILKELGERFFATPLSLAASQAGACAEPVNTLIDLVLEFRKRLQEKKRENKVVDFSDMEHFALDILLERREGQVCASQVALEYRQYFKEILIDEYQDSNLVQEYLLKVISGEEDGQFNRFMVGDVKQSIYKFRLARPELFLEKYDEYTQEDSSCQRIDLARNFRSRREVVDTVNGIFAGIMSRQTGGIAYDDRAALYVGADYYPENAGCGSELLLVEEPGGEGGQPAGGSVSTARIVSAAGSGQPAGGSVQAAGSGWLADGSAALIGSDRRQTGSGKAATLTPRQAEALAIAHRIKELLADFQVTDKATGQLRPVRFSDMVILLRTNSGWDEVFKSVLEEEGIPVYITSKTGYFAASEVQELLSLLRVLDNPRQDIPLFGVMKSLFGGFDEEEIALLRSTGQDLSLYEAVQAAAQTAASREEVTVILSKQEPTEENYVEGKHVEKCHVQESLIKASHATLPAALCQKAAAFLEKIDRYRSYTSYMPIRELLETLVKENGYLAYVTALPMGSRRRANVEMLFTKASDFEKTSYHGLFHFIRYMEQLEKYDVDYGEAELLDENADVVRIMSIHKSKGLEFPVTFVSGLSKRFNMQDVNSALIADVDMGIGTDYVDPQRRIRNKTLRRRVIARKMREDNLAEELRVLYVALTRPKEKLIMTASLQDAAGKWERQKTLASDRLLFHEFMESANYLDFLLPMVDKSCVSVRIVDTSELQSAGSREQIQLLDRRNRLELAADYARKDTLKELKDRFAWQYPHRALEKLYTKTTVSELKIAAMAEKDEAAYHAFEEQEIVPYIPLFKRGEEKISGAVRGNAFHKVMELMDFEVVYEGVDVEALAESILVANDSKDKAQPDKVQQNNVRLYENLQHFLTRAVASKRLSHEYRQAVNDRKLVHFLTSSLAIRMYLAEKRGDLYREQPFVYGVSAGRLGEDYPEQEKVLIQGIIDAFFVEEGALVLVDYKTDVIDGPVELWKRYETQVQYYEEALCKLMNLPMKQKILYSFYLEECVDASAFNSDHLVRVE